MKTPIQTENLALGIALYLAGVRPWSDECFAFVLYDEKIVESLGCTTVKQAIKEGRAGHRVMSFDMTDSEKYSFLSEMWDAEKKAIELNLPTELSEGVQPEDIVKIAARVLHCRKQLTQHWQDLPIFAMVSNGAATAGREEGSIDHPGYRMVSIRASEAMLQKLGFDDQGAIVEQEGDEDGEE